MRVKPKSIQIENMIYWSSGDDIGECEHRHCKLPAFSYNENGEKFCEECLIECHEKQDEQITWGTNAGWKAK